MEPEPEADAIWEQIAGELFAAGNSHDHEDDVQETLLSLLAVDEVEHKHLLRLRWMILRRRRADRLRREARFGCVLSGRLEKVPVPCSGAGRNLLAEALLRDQELVKMLGASAVHLLMHILEDGARGTGALANRLRRAEATVRVRRHRIQRLLLSHLEEMVQARGPREDP